MSIGLTEIVILAIIALIVMGPERFPDFAKVVIRTFRDLRSYVDEAKHELTKELRPVQKELQQLSKYEPKSYLNEVSKPAKAAASSEKPKHSAPAASKDTMDAQNIVDPSLADEESTTYQYKSADFGEAEEPKAPAEKPQPIPTPEGEHYPD